MQLSNLDADPKKLDELKGAKGDRPKNHRLTLTCVCINSTNENVYTGSKDGSIIKWSIKNPRIIAKVNSAGKRTSKNSKDTAQKHHIRHINCIAISSDDKFLATGGWDKLIRIWSPDDLSWLHTFSMHRQEVTSLIFRVGVNTLYSGSTDKSVMLWTLEDDDNRCFVESLYGHESAVTSLDSLRRERVLSSGGLDRSLRVWKIVEQAQTVFESQHESADVVKYIDDKTFVSGGTDGSITLWTTMKRSPLLTLRDAHQTNRKFTEMHQTIDDLRYDQKDFSFWISALATYSSSKVQQLKTKKRKRKVSDEDDEDAEGDDDGSSDHSDSENEAIPDIPKASTILIASGSCNSEIKIWKLVKVEGKFELLLHQTLECHGFVNDLKFSSDGDKLVAACGQEHKFGRWWKLKGSKNRMQIFNINK